MAGAIDEDTARTLQSGRQTIWSVLGAAQSHLKKVFLIFVTGMMLTIWALRAFLWDKLEKDLVRSKMDAETSEGTEIVATTPFDVILLQVKIGLMIGIIVAIPALIWFSRKELKQRGYWPTGVPRWKIAGVIVTIIMLGIGGMLYAYLLFFPIMFNFLAENAIKVGFKPTWSIVMWTEFIFFLSLSFMVAAQLPLAMSSLARGGVVPYETFRDRWRHAVLIIFVFGAVFSPPDPFTQIMWGAPLVALYGISLAITKVAVLSKRVGQEVSTIAVARKRWNKLAAAFVLSVAGIYAYFYEGGIEASNDLLSSIGSQYRVVLEPSEMGLFGLPPTMVVFGIGIMGGTVIAGIVTYYYRIKELEVQSQKKPKEAPQSAAGEGETGADAAEDEQPTPGEEATIDLGGMSKHAIQAASVEAFVEMDEANAVKFAEQAVENDNPQKAKAILNRLDEAEELREQREEEQEDEEDENVVTSTAAGMIDPFTEDETTEDDIGGYYYDIQFILASLTSKAIWLVAAFILTMVATFAFLYRGGIGEVKQVFFDQMPEQIASEPEIVVLHPVEALIFMLKFSMLMGGVALLPFVLYFAWPAVEERGITTGNRNVLLVWGFSMLFAIVGGTALGFLYIAPTILSLLARDVVTSNMIIAYRISSFGWLIIYLTVGVGILTMIPVTMVLFHHGNIIPRHRMRKHWRVVVLAFFAVAGFYSPKGIFTMFLVAIPASLAYGLGLGLLRLYDFVNPWSSTPQFDTAD